MELENLERRIFPPGRAVVHQDSLTDGGPGGGQDGTNQIMAALEANFAKLKIATGLFFRLSNNTYTYKTSEDYVFITY